MRKSTAARNEKGYMFRKQVRIKRNKGSRSRGHYAGAGSGSGFFDRFEGVAGGVVEGAR